MSAEEIKARLKHGVVQIFYSFHCCAHLELHLN